MWERYAMPQTCELQGRQIGVTAGEENPVGSPELALRGVERAMDPQLSACRAKTTILWLGGHI